MSPFEEYKILLVSQVNLVGRGIRPTHIGDQANMLWSEIEYEEESEFLHSYYSFLLEALK